MDTRSPLPPILIRAATHDELKLIKHSWFKSLQRESDLGRLVRPDSFSPGANALIEKLINVCLPVVSTLEAVPDEVIGWVCRDPGAIHYLYVKGPYRRHGVGTRLTFGAQTYTIRTKDGEPFFRSVGAQYNPFTLMV